MLYLMLALTYLSISTSLLDSSNEIPVMVEPKTKEFYNEETHMRFVKYTPPSIKFCELDSNDKLFKLML